MSERKLVTSIAVHGGAGGEESQDWARMLRHMYRRWAERQELPMVGESEEGFAVFGGAPLESEAGVHRLVRISPFDAQSRRHTSFALVAVTNTVERKRRFRRLKLETVELPSQWGMQIRSYILHPYKAVKDHRTGFERDDPGHVLDGDLEGFVPSAVPTPPESGPTFEAA